MPSSTKEIKLEKDFDKGTFSVGASFMKMSCWYFVNLLIFRSGMVPFSNILVFFLRMFGAKIGREVRIKPHIQIKYPWKLVVGDYSWLSNCTIENLDTVIIGKHVCISQGAQILTGNHNYNLVAFDLFTRKVVLQDGVWICAGSIVCPGVVAQSHAILCVGSVTSRDLEAHGIYQGNPAKKIRNRSIR